MITQSRLSYISTDVSLSKMQKHFLILLRVPKERKQQHLTGCLHPRPRVLTRDGKSTREARHDSTLWGPRNPTNPHPMHERMNRLCHLTVTESAFDPKSVFQRDRSREGCPETTVVQYPCGRNNLRCYDPTREQRGLTSHSKALSYLQRVSTKPFTTVHDRGPEDTTVRA